MNKEHIYFTNQSAIYERIVGACILYLLQDTTFSSTTHRKLGLKANSENLQSFIEVTAIRVQEYFRTKRADSTFSDFQASLALSIYSTYCYR